MRHAVGTSLVVIPVLAVPTLATHWALGPVDWSLAGPFAIGVILASFAGGVLARRVDGLAMRRAFGWFLIGCGVLFSLRRLVSFG